MTPGVRIASDGAPTRRGRRERRRAQPPGRTPTRSKPETKSAVTTTNTGNVNREGARQDCREGTPLNPYERRPDERQTFRTADDQLAELIEQARRFLDIIEEGRTAQAEKPAIISGFTLLKRTKPRRDGHRPNTLGGGTRASVLDDEGDPMPPVNDPVGELVVNTATHIDPARRRAKTMLNQLDRAVGNLSGAVSALGQASTPAPVEDNPGCRNHQRIGQWEPIDRSERCWWCYQWNLAHGEDAPIEILERRARGERITTKVVEQVLGRRTANARR